MANQTKTNLEKQKKTLTAAGTAAAILIGVYLYWSIDTQEAEKNASTAHAFELAAEQEDPKQMWMARLDDERKMLEKRLDQLENLIVEEKRSQGKKQQENDALKKEVNYLRDSLHEVQTNQEIASAPPLSNSPQEELFSYSYEPAKQPTFLGRELKEVTATLPKDKVQHVSTVIPAGTSVKAVLVSSTDIPCGVYSQTDPQPVKLQVLDDARLPKQVRVKLKGGIVIGSAHGDLSSERIYIRTERLTQTKRSGDFVETEVTGYITGEDGKYGVRGRLIDKSGRIVKNAAVSGFFSGVNQVLQSHGDRTNISYNNPEQDNFAAAGNILRSGSVAGANNAFDRLTDYFIKQADQVSPVIEVNAGRVVDITFTHGCEVGDLHTKDKVSAIRKRNRVQGEDKCLP